MASARLESDHGNQAGSGSTWVGSEPALDSSRVKSSRLAPLLGSSWTCLEKSGSTSDNGLD